MNKVLRINYLNIVTTVLPILVIISFIVGMDISIKWRLVLIIACMVNNIIELDESLTECEEGI